MCSHVIGENIFDSHQSMEWRNDAIYLCGDVNIYVSGKGCPTICSLKVYAIRTQCVRKYSTTGTYNASDFRDS